MLNGDVGMDPLIAEGYACVGHRGARRGAAQTGH
jgi:hypothetical protein